ncbi:MAG: glycosyltransferase family 2 protein [Thermoplasmata archaeon]
MGSAIAGAHIPLGGIPVGVGIGLALYYVLASLARRPGRAPTPVERMRPLSRPAAGVPSGTALPPPAEAPLRLFGRAGFREMSWTRASGAPPPPVPRARGFVLVLLLGFIASAMGLLLAYGELFGAYDHWVGLVGSLLYWPEAWPGVYAVRDQALVVPDYIFPMYLAGMVGLLLADAGVTRGIFSSRRRSAQAFAVVVLFVAVELVLDALFFTIPGAALRDLALLVRAFTGGLFLLLLVLLAVHLPPPMRLEPRFGRLRSDIAVFFGVGALSILVALIPVVGFLALSRYSAVPVGFTLLLLLPLLTLVFYGLIARAIYFQQLVDRPRPPLDVYHPFVTIAIPAYNEEVWIEEVVRSADRAAARYPGRVEIIVGNDGSTDRTLVRARRAVGRIEHAQGYVVDLPHGGKSNALNGILAVARGEIFLRLDGDTILSESPGFAAMIPHFADPMVGGVQGTIHPYQKKGWTRKLRALEIAWMHYLLRPAGMATRSAEVIDGLFSAYRRQDLLDLGGYVPWNGEDTEFSIRIQRLGYRIRIEFGALAYEDVPPTYAALRRQRVRWARGILMANGMHYEALLGPSPEHGGLGVLFWLIGMIRSGVRSLVYVFLLLLFVTLGVPALFGLAALLLVAVGIRGVPLAYFLVKMKRYDVLPWIPFFPIGSALKQSFRFEAMGTLGVGSAQEFF